MRFEIVVNAVKRAKRYTDNAEFSAMDATRSDWDYLCQVFSAVIDAGAITLNVPDTVGYAVPDEFGKLIYYIAMYQIFQKQLSAFTVIMILVWLLQIRLQRSGNGARQIECTINGIGERAGNAL